MAPTKQLVRDSAHIVDNMLEGLVRAQPHLALVADEKVLLHRDYATIREKQVTLISGGGSGHEPAHAGYIGEGMLTGVVCGHVFASPSTQQVLAAIRLAAGPHGCLVIVKNYTGDRLNFGLAVEQAKSEGLLVDMVIVGEDVAVVNANAGRRGLSGTVYVHKLAGAAAASGMALPALVDLVHKVSANDALGTIGVALRPCTLPGQEGPSRELGVDEMELGLGIHGEPGIEKCGLQDAPVVTERMVARLSDALALTTGAPAVVLMVNNLGASTTMELFVVARHAIEALEKRGVTVARTVVGSFMTALDMSGFSLTAWKVAADEQAQLLTLFDAPTTATAWNYTPYATSAGPSQRVAAPSGQGAAAAPLVRPQQLSPGAQALDKCIRAACEQLVASEPELTLWDSKVGDGDCGLTFKGAAECILADLATCYPLNDAPATLGALAGSVSKSAGGTSGVLYTIFFTSARAAMEALSVDEQYSAAGWATALSAATAAVQRYGGASEGSRTMLDALLPAARALTAGTAVDAGVDVSAALQATVAAAVDGADKTRRIPTAQAFGRSGYVGEESAADVPDPGAMAAAIWIRAVVDAL